MENAYLRNNLIAISRALLECGNDKCKGVIPIIPLVKMEQVGIMGITSVGGVAMGQEELMNKIAELEREIIEGAAIFADIYASCGMNYNADTTFSNSRTAEEYIDTAIAKNIQHSLKMYQYGGHYPA